MCASLGLPYVERKLAGKISEPRNLFRFDIKFRDAGGFPSIIYQQLYLGPLATLGTNASSQGAEEFHSPSFLPRSSMFSFVYVTCSGVGISKSTLQVYLPI